jgi:UDP-glucose 6-dehydrogenase
MQHVLVNAQKLAQKLPRQQLARSRVSSKVKVNSEFLVKGRSVEDLTTPPVIHLVLYSPN